MEWAFGCVCEVCDCEALLTAEQVPFGLCGPCDQQHGDNRAEKMETFMADLKALIERQTEQKEVDRG